MRHCLVFQSLANLHNSSAFRLAYLVVGVDSSGSRIRDIELIHITDTNRSIHFGIPLSVVVVSAKAS